METLHTWWATELYPMRERDQFGVSGEFEVVLATDAQATIAALQARVKELEAIKAPDDTFTYCAFCGEKSPVDEHSEDLLAHIKVCLKHLMRDVEAQLAERTRERDRWQSKYDVAQMNVKNWQDKYEYLLQHRQGMEGVNES